MDTTNAPQIIEHMELPLTFTPFDTRWIPNSARFVLMGQTPGMKGILQIFKLNQGKHEKEYEKIFDNKGIKCATFHASSDARSGRQMAFCDFQGKLYIWDVEKQTISFEANAHSSMINALDGTGGIVGYGAPEIVTGGRDGAVRVWDPRQSEAAVSLEPQKDQEIPDCWTVAFGNNFTGEDRCLAAGYDNGDVKLFDLRVNCLKWDTNLNNGICGIEFDRKDCQMNKLVCTTLESKFHVFDLRTQHPEKGFTGLECLGPKSTVWGVRHLPQNRDLFTILGGNGRMNIQQYKQPSRRQEEDLEGIKRGLVGGVNRLNEREISTQPIVSLDWHTEKLGLAVCSMLDQKCKVIITTKLNLQ